MSEDPAKYAGLGAARTTCQRIPRGRGAQVCLTRPDTPGPTVHGPSDVQRLLRSQAERLPTESFYALLLNIRNEVLGIQEISRGTATGVDVHPRDVFQGAIVANAAAVVVAHNHPSGDPQPSADDMALTKRLKDAGQLLGIPVLDHIVLGRDSFTSMAEVGTALEPDDEDYG